MNQSLEILHDFPYLKQITATNYALNKRLSKFVKRVRCENSLKNQREFCNGLRNSEYTCARSNTAFEKRSDSKSHLIVNRTVNSYQHRDQHDFDYMAKFIPSNGIEERLENVECQLSINNPVPKNIYQRLQVIEDRLLHLESLSPEYIQLWDKATLVSNLPRKKKIFSIEEIDELIADVENKRKK